MTDYLSDEEVLAAIKESPVGAHLSILRGNYQIFNAPGGSGVITDLIPFCRAIESTFDPNPYIAARLDGRREVFLRINDHLNLSTEQLYTMAGGRRVNRIRSKKDEIFGVSEK